MQGTEHSNSFLQCQDDFTYTAFFHDMLSIFNYGVWTMLSPGERSPGRQVPVHKQGHRRRSDGVDGRDGSERDPDSPHPFAALLNELFATRLTPRGRPYTLTEVSRATKLSVSYLSTLRSGGIDAVPFDRVDALARFFQVPLEYFSQGSRSSAWSARSRRKARPGVPPGREDRGDSSAPWCWRCSNTPPACCRHSRATGHTTPASPGGRWAQARVRPRWARTR
jgi:hypothetical protein